MFKALCRSKLQQKFTRIPNCIAQILHQKNVFKNRALIFSALISYLGLQWLMLINTGEVSLYLRLASCLFCFDSVALLMLNEQQFYFFGQILISQTGGQPYSDTSPYGEYSLINISRPCSSCLGIDNLNVWSIPQCPDLHGAYVTSFRAAPPVGKKR